ncbi:MAG: 2Fe-2S iron-sulfur cluster-binding protein [Rhizomicrobium sp.]
MPIVTFVAPDGREITVKAAGGRSLMEAAVAAQVPGIDADCGGACSCATCHVHVNAAWLERVGPPGATESQMLEFDGNVTERSRLACQITLTDALDGIAVTVVGRR